MATSWSNCLCQTRGKCIPYCRHELYLSHGVLPCNLDLHDIDTVISVSQRRCKCGNVVSERSKTGRCKPCSMRGNKNGENKKKNNKKKKQIII